jgi:uncharacterized membrane protein (DUF2068 family)
MGPLGPARIGTEVQGKSRSLKMVEQKGLQCNDYWLECFTVIEPGIFVRMSLYMYENHGGVGYQQGSVCV